MLNLLLQVDVMAAVMAAGMVPHWLIKAMHSKINSHKVTKHRYELSLHHEGAIPFGAADPARAIP